MRLLMNRISQEAYKHQAVVKLAKRKEQTYASQKYGISLSSVRRWCKRYDRTWQSLKECSHSPHSHPKRYTGQEETLIHKSLNQAYFRYEWKGAYMATKDLSYRLSYSWAAIYECSRIRFVCICL